jgi:uncharacterized protein (DUF2141 family)
LTVTGRATIGTNLTVSGNTTLGGASKTITMGGASSTLTIGGAGHTTNTSGWFGVAGRATVSTNLFVGGNTFIMGNMGIGTSSPAGYGSGITTIDVEGTNGGGIKFGTGSASYGVYLNSTAAYVQTFNSTPIVVATNNAERMRIASSGLVTACNSMTVTQNFTVSGNTTINGTTTDKSNALSQTLTDGATISWDTSLGRVATVTLAGNRTIAAPTNLKVGTYILNIIQDATGSRTMTWNAVFKWTAGVAPPLTTTAAARDIFSFFSDGTNLYGSFLPDVK